MNQLKNNVADLVDFKKGNGLVPAIAQDVRTGRVLMMAYMNEEALRTTLKEEGHVTGADLGRNYGEKGPRRVMFN